MLSKLPIKQSLWYEKLSASQRNGADFTIERLRDGGGVALFAEQGSGKTLISLAVLEKLPQLRFILIVTPLTSIKLTWTDRLRLNPGYRLCYSWDEFKEHQRSLCRGCTAIGKTCKVPLVHSRPSRATQGGHTTIALVMPYRLFTNHSRKIAKFAWDIVLFDEAQALKGRNSAQSRAARRLRNVKRRLILSGTPVDKSPIDVWGQMRFVDHEVLGEDWQVFADEYCHRAGFMGKKWEFNRDKLPQFLESLENHIFRLSIDSFGVAQPSFHLVPVVLLGEQARIYQDMDEEGLVKIGRTTVKADLAITKKIKKEQITGGFIYHEDEVIKVGGAKLRKLDWLLKKLKPPLVVSCKFLEEVDDVLPILKQHFARVEYIAGDIKDTRKGEFRTDTVRRFQNGETDALVIQTRTGGVSIELSRAHKLVIYSMNHSRIDFSQLISRLRRWGQKEVVEIYILYAINTVDEEIKDIVERKVTEAREVEYHFQKE